MADDRQTTKGGARTGARGGARSLADSGKVNALAELLGDLLEATGLVTSDKLAEARAETGATGSLVSALVEHGAIPAARVAEVPSEGLDPEALGTLAATHRREEAT